MPINPYPYAKEGNSLKIQITGLIGFLVEGIILRININTTKIPPFKFFIIIINIEIPKIKNKK